MLEHHLALTHFKLTEKAKKTSTLALTGLAAGAGAKGSLVLKLAG
jgi:hypothetical protein